MSLWFRRKDKQGRMHYYSINIPLIVVVAVFGIVIALLMPLIHSCREWIRAVSGQ